MNNKISTETTSATTSISAVMGATPEDPPPSVSGLARRGFSVAEVGEMYGRSESTVRNWIDDGLLQRNRVLGRLYPFFPADLDEFEARVRRMKEDGHGS